ncbi:MAG: hypothetical protein FWH41_04935 [Treponema sp.]|nr:hypothetical protein [Treponema sp.]
MIETGDCVLIIDCCGLKKNSAELRRCEGKSLYVLASHAHGDHFDKKIMSFDHLRLKWILSDDIRGKIPLKKDLCFLAKGGAYRDEKVAVKAFGSTDEGVSFYIETGGKRVFHAGDLNNWHWNEEETPQDAAKNEKAFLDELALIAREIPVLDAVMFPVDPRLGKDYTRGAEQFLDSVKTGLFIPMHFWDDIDAARAFKPKAEKRGCRFAEIRAAGDEFEI